MTDDWQAIMQWYRENMQYYVHSNGFDPVPYSPPTDEPLCTLDGWAFAHHSDKDAPDEA
jgi:hypothetical protein